MSAPEGEGEEVVVTHWCAVNQDGGTALSLSSRDDSPGFRARARVEAFCADHPQYRLEVWEQVFRVSPSEWRKVAAS